MDLMWFKRYPNYVAAALLLMVFFSQLAIRWDQLDYYFTNNPIYLLDLLNMFLSGIGALILIFMRDRGLDKVLIICSTIFALISLHDAYETLHEYSDISEYSIENFIQGILMLAFSLMLLINTLLYATKTSANTTMLFIGTIGVMGMNIIQILDFARYGVTLKYLAKYCLTETVPLVLLMIFMLIIMKSDEVKTNTIMYNIKDSITDIRKNTPMGVYIVRSLLPELQKIGRNGMCCDSYEVELISYNSDTYRLVLAKNGDRTSVSFSSKNDRTAISRTRFILKGVWLDTDDPETCDLVRIYGTDGFFIQLIAKDPDGKDSDNDDAPPNSAAPTPL
jgi:hypothetical protein